MCVFSGLSLEAAQAGETFYDTDAGTFGMPRVWRLRKGLPPEGDTDTQPLACGGCYEMDDWNSNRGHGNRNSSHCPLDKQGDTGGGDYGKRKK